MHQPMPSAPSPDSSATGPVFVASVLLIGAVVLCGVLAPEAVGNLFGALQAWILDRLGWFYLLAVAVFLGFVLYLALSRHGRVKLGPNHAEPDFSYNSWFAMLFSAGMGIGLVFFGVAEPVTHFMLPPVGEGGTVEAARIAMRVTFFHWGVHAWAIYAVVGLSLAYFSFRHGLPLTIRSSLYPLIGDRIHGPIGQAVDVFAVLGTVFGVATSLGLGVLQINAGLSRLAAVPQDLGVQVALIAAITAMATVSVVLGLEGGIRRLSVFNMALAFILLLFVAATGPTVFLLKALVQNLGGYIDEIVPRSFMLYAYEPNDWVADWTLFYWAWWISWSPFVGMFIARISRGRTIREFVLGVLFVPMGFTAVWMTVFGNTAIDLQISRGVTTVAEAAAANTPLALFAFLEQFPLSTITSALATLLVMTFFVTSADSAALVVDTITANGAEATPAWRRALWAGAMGAVAAVLLFAGGLRSLQTATIASALPFTVIMLAICWGLHRALQLETLRQTSLGGAGTSTVAASAAGGAQAGTAWRKQLQMILHQPSRAEVEAFLAEVAEPALRAVAKELAARGVEAQVERGEGRVRLIAMAGAAEEFRYGIRARGYEAPSFSFSDARARRDADGQRYWRAEVFLREGGQDYDVMGFDQGRLISDVLVQYERHLNYLQAVDRA